MPGLFPLDVQRQAVLGVRGGEYLMGKVVEMFRCPTCGAGPFPNRLALRLHRMNTHGTLC